MLRMVEEAEKLDKFSKLMDVVGNKVEIGGDLEVDGDLLEHAISKEAKEFAQSEYDKTLNLSVINNYSNTETDTRQTIIFAINSDSLNIVYTEVDTIGFYSRTFSIPNDDYYTFRHSGAVKDLIFERIYLKAGEYTISFNADGINSSVIGGLSLSNIMINKGSQALPFKEYNGEVLHRKDVPDYSFNEVNTHQKWVNGKDIYRRVIFISAISSGSTYDYTNFKSPDNLINMYGMTIAGSYAQPLSSKQYDQSAFVELACNGSGIHIKNGMTRSIANTYLIIEYTK